ncbi:unnamed protein product, partial [Staurois parvus]
FIHLVLWMVLQFFGLYKRKPVFSLLYAPFLVRFCSYIFYFYYYFLIFGAIHNILKI